MQGQDGERERESSVCGTRPIFSFLETPGGHLLYFCPEKRPGGTISNMFCGPPREAFVPFFTVFWTSGLLVDVPAGVTDEEGHTEFLHLPVTAPRFELTSQCQKVPRIPTVCD